MTTGLTLEVRTEAASQALARIGQGLTPETLLKLVGQRHLAWIAENFRREGAENPWASMRPTTRAGRRGGGGGAKLLQDTGALRRFVAEVRGESVAVGTVDQKAPWHHLGTRPYRIAPRTKKALKFMSPQGEVVRRFVNHPGLPARQLLPSDGLARSLALGVLDAYVARLVAGAAGGGGPTP